MEDFLSELSDSFQDVASQPNNSFVATFEDSPDLAALSLTRSLFQATLVAAFTMLTVFWAGYLPGHTDGRMDPWYIPEHYGPRNSRHLFDPYSVVHFDFGLLAYYLFGRFDENRSDSEDLFDDSGSVNWSKGMFTDENLGLFMTLYFAATFESVENSELLIQMFRENSGTSKEYRGDSAINVFGDMITCALGYNFAKFLSRRGFSHLPLIVFFLNELSLGLDIRDNLLLIIVQLIFPSDKIKKWQEEIIPYEYKN